MKSNTLVYPCEARLANLCRRIEKQMADILDVADEMALRVSAVTEYPHACPKDSLLAKRLGTLAAANKIYSSARATQKAGGA
jgi:hypothetical protein